MKRRASTIVEAQRAGSGSYVVTAAIVVHQRSAFFTLARSHWRNLCEDRDVRQGREVMRTINVRLRAEVAQVYARRYLGVKALNVVNRKAWSAGPICRKNGLPKRAAGL